MGLREWITKKALNKTINEAKKKSGLELSLDNYVSDAIKRHSDAQRTADKILKARILEKQTEQTLRKIKDLEEEEEEDEEEEEEEESLGDKLIKDLAYKFLNKGLGEEKQQQLSGFVEGLTKEQKDLIKEKIGIDF